MKRTSTSIDVLEPDYAARNDRWLTPLPIIRALGSFDLDPAGAPGHPTAQIVWTPEIHGDGLAMPWDGRVWLNPPYGRTMGDWLRRLAVHGRGTALVYARTDTADFHQLVFPLAHGMLFLRRRVKFLRDDGTGAESRLSGPAPSVLIAYGRVDAEALRVSGLDGHYVDLKPQDSQP
jgi:hypothetical protein